MKKEEQDYAMIKSAYPKPVILWELKYFETFQTKPEAFNKELEINVSKI